MGGPAASTIVFIIRSCLLWPASGMDTMAGPFLKNIEPLADDFGVCALHWYDQICFRSVLWSKTISTQCAFLLYFPGVGLQFCLL